MTTDEFFLITKAALSSPNKAGILWVLYQANGAGVSTREVASALGISESTASFILTGLHRSGLVDRNRDGPSMRYSTIEEKNKEFWWKAVDLGVKLPAKCFVVKSTPN